ncbi:MAG: M28 family peptidase [Candidatus Eisenbacteria bacterium]|nr:M28 family peptidase [Candidatus Latescibacterota bacterium]MBD3302742.1 M28 family peptidase [Candidatus Eisenbacteria bacterium]
MGRILRWVLPLLAFPAWAGDLPDFDTPRAWEHLIAQCRFGPRVPGSEGHRRCAAYLEETLRATGGDVVLQPFRTRPEGFPEEVEMTNVLARFGPSGPPILLGAHWDTRRWADEDPDSTRRDEPILGANDGASGVAVLLALAERFATAPPPVAVEIALFDGEDQGSHGSPESWCLGSREHVRRRVGTAPRIAIIVDIVGGEDLRICREEYSETYAPWLNDLIFARAQALGLQAFEDRVCYSVYDDHVPFLERGVPAVDLVDMHFPQWHTHEDVPGSCSPESLGQIGTLLVDLVYGGALD